jgi:RNA polymerase sigma factor (sigma-70 family)
MALPMGSRPQNLDGFPVIPESNVNSAWRAVREETPDLMRAQERAVRFEDEYSAFYRAEFTHVVRTAYLIVHDRQRAEDVAQEAFVQLLAHWSKVSRYQQPGAWVRRVAIRIASRSARRERVRPALEQGTDASPVFAPQDVDLLNAIKRLPPRQRAAVALFYFEDRPLPEVADILGCSHAAAKVHVFNARRRLAALLGEEVSDGDRL